MSSLVFLGLSIIAFAVSFGIVWILVPMTLGAFDAALSNSTLLTSLSPAWLATYNTNQSNLQWLIPLTANLAIFIFVLKVLMVASVRGSD